MAIIKCPECGHQISDKAPVCPNCGVEIAGKLHKCAVCGNVYFYEEEMCPNCHTATPRNNNTAAINSERGEWKENNPTLKSATPNATGEGTSTLSNGNNDTQKKKKKSRMPWVISFVIALIICAVCFYLYQKANDDKELEEYSYAMKSTDPLVLQNYLDNFKTAPQAHRDSIEAHLQAIQQADANWTNAVVSKSKAELENYIKLYPNSIHRIEALHIIDSLDWAQASTLNTPEAYQNYLATHADGTYATEAQQLFDKLNATVVSDDDKQMISQLFRVYFQSINNRDENSLTGTLATILTSFLGKENATKNDVVNFLHKIYKEGIENITFRLNNDFKIDKKEVGVNQYEYSVTFSADETVNNNTGEKELNVYKIKATVSPDGKISGFNMNKIVSE
jgi:hypothetical protein